MMTIRLASALAALATALPAQQVLVVPNARATSEGNSLDVKPFGYRQVRHEHYIGRPQLLPLGSAATIRSLSYRRDGEIAGTFIRTDDATTTWAVRMANVTVNPLDPGTAFVPAAQLTTVFTPKVVSWPQLPPPPVGRAAPFNISFVLDVPFSYTGGHIVISHFCYSVSMGGIVVFGYFCDAEGPGPGGAGTVTGFGAGCPAGESRATGIAPNPGGGSLALFLHGGVPGTVTLACVGSSDQSWNGVPLPLALDGIGLPGCSLYTDLRIIVPASVQASGLAETSLPVPADPSLSSARLFAQFVNLQDPRINAQLRITTSDALDLRLGTSLGGQTPETSVVVATFAQANATGGLLYSGEGPVVQLGY
jgi:hypothetical protein